MAGNKAGNERDWKPIVGVATVTATAIAGAVPMAQAAPVQDDGPSPLRQDAGDATRTSGAYESCDAYFGYGKDDYGVGDLVAFDVVDDNGSDGTAHAFPTDTEVVFHITTEEGVITCAPDEVTEEEWDQSMVDVLDYTLIGETPAWPGPGHYAYPSIVWEPSIGDGPSEVLDVTFEVVGVPAEHTLVSPTGVTPLVQNHLINWDFWSGTVDPEVISFVEAEAGPAAAAALEDAVMCDLENVTYTQDTVDAVNAILTDFGTEPTTLDDLTCWGVIEPHANKSLELALIASTTYTETIHLQVPEDPTTTSTTTTVTGGSTPTTPTSAQVATPVSATPRYTG